jgi:hypothetical protein
MFEMERRDRTYSYRKHPFANPASTNAQLASLSMDSVSVARSWQAQRFTTQDLRVPWPFGSVERLKTTAERAGVERKVRTVSSVDFIFEGTERSLVWMRVGVIENM